MARPKKTTGQLVSSSMYLDIQKEFKMGSLTGAILYRCELYDNVLCINDSEYVDLKYDGLKVQGTTKLITFMRETLGIDVHSALRDMPGHQAKDLLEDIKDELPKQLPNIK